MRILSIQTKADVIRSKIKKNKAKKKTHISVSFEKTRTTQKFLHPSTISIVDEFSTVLQ